jgi:thioredoxin-like negative regulator of GroEL
MRSMWVWIAACLLGLFAVIWGGWRRFDDVRFRRALEQADRDIAQGRIRQARQRLADLTKRRLGSGEAAYQLGICEEKLGHAEAALTAWSAIAAESPFFIKGSIGRALVLMNAGRFSLAENLLASLPRDTGPYAAHVRQEIEVLLRIEGRTQEARDLIVEAWRGATDPSEVVQRLYLLEDAPYPLDYVKEALTRGNPADERVWLGHANLATWSGRFHEAARWLDACERQRPFDQAVWLARLQLATSSRDPDAARRAVRHLKAAWFLPFEVCRLRAWLAAFRGDPEAERRGLLDLVAAEPGNTNAWARLAELAHQDGRPLEAESFRKKQAEMSALRERYDQLIMLDERGRHVDELARLAQALGRTIEARGWSLIQQGRATAEPLWPDNTLDAPNRRQAAEMLSSWMDEPRAHANESQEWPAGTSALIPPAFTDDAQVAGLRFWHDNGHTGEYLRPPVTMCGGVGLLDYDGDGWLDVFAVQGGPFPPAGSAAGDGDRLFRNRGDGTFEDATERTGISSFPRGYGHGVTVGDFDNDGRPDLFVTRWRSYALYRNTADGRFEDVTGRVGLSGDRDWPTSAAFADLDGDGDLDIYVCHYLIYDPGKPTLCEHPGVPNRYDCMPRDFPALADHVFRNDNRKFVDVTKHAGFIDPNGRGLGVVAADLDDDNKIDLYVANDGSANYLFHNRGGFRFEETGEIAGAAASADGLYKAGMGIACGDLDGDGSLDLAVTNFFAESTTFYRNLGRGRFADDTARIGLLAPSRPLLGFGVAFPDLNNDGWLDLIVTNGHTLDSRPRIPWKMPLQLMLGQPGCFLTDVSDRAGAPFRPLHLGRGLALGDLDNDGRLDVVVLNQNEPLVYLHNRTEHPGHFIRFSLEGTRSNRDAVGARVTIHCGSQARISERTGGGSYLSAGDPRLHFGLGAIRQVDSVDVRWPSGQVDHHRALAADREYRLREGAEPREVKTARATSSNRVIPSLVRRVPRP